MVYSNRFVMCVIIDGKVQKESSEGKVAIPFDSEYVLRFRNKYSRRAMVKIFIDGENVSGEGYVIPANQHIDIQRHHDVNHAFKFVALDSPDAVEYGKNGANPDKIKGTIEARFWLEKEQPKVVEHHYHYHHYDNYLKKYLHPTPYPCTPPWGGDEYGTTITWNSSSVPCGSGSVSSNSSGEIQMCCATTSSVGSVPISAHPPLQEGCTVEGSSTNQSFYTTNFEAEADYVALKLFLVGYHKDAHTSTAEVKYCTNCGSQRIKKSAKFCYNCGAKI